MDSQDIIDRRLTNQQIAGKGFTMPSDLVRWMGCIKAEDFTAAKWAIGSRVEDSTDETIEHAFNRGNILRAHVLQPGWHFISPEDIRWMLSLTSSRLRSFNKDIYQLLGIDPLLLTRSKRIMTRELEKGQLTRPQLRQILERERIHTDELRLGWLLMDAELDGLICSGGMEGRQFTYALLDQRAPPMGQGQREEYIAELTRRYFLSRGPATVRDFAGWSGLDAADIKTGMESNRQWLVSEVVGGQVYWFDPSATVIGDRSSLYLLPALDEWVIAYAGNSCFKPLLVIDGQIAGTWMTLMGKDTVSIQVDSPVKIGGAWRDQMQRLFKRYGHFLGRNLI